MEEPETVERPRLQSRYEAVKDVVGLISQRQSRDLAFRIFVGE